jgi:AraC-like DNA-binding protein
MLKSLMDAQKFDRLSAFVKTFDLSVCVNAPPGPPGDATLLILAGDDRRAVQLVFSAGGATDLAAADAVLASAVVEFGGTGNPLLGALPSRLEVDLNERPELRTITEAFVAEASDARCGREAALERLSEVIVLMLLRHAIDRGATVPGLLAGLSHPTLHRALVAMHDTPARGWRIDDLADLASMSRSRFMTSFRDTVGMTPGAYLTHWRLTLARRAILRGGRVKTTAADVGFNSVAAFSRAYSRRFGHAPTETRRSVTA